MTNPIFSSGNKTSTPNLYLATLMDPPNYPNVFVPDMNGKPSVTKTVTIGSTIVTDGQPLLLIVMPNSPGHRVILMRQCIAPPRFAFHGYIGSDEILPESYTAYRPVSSLFRAKSATVSAGDFAVSGTFNVVGVETLPSLNNLTFDTIASARQNDRAYLVQQPVQDGVVCITPPDENHEFVRWEWYNESSGSDLYRLRFRQQVGDQKWIPTKDPSAPNQMILFDSGDFDYNFGVRELTCNASFEMSNTALMPGDYTMKVKLRALTAWYNSATKNEALAWVELGSSLYSFVISGSGNQSRVLVNSAFGAPFGMISGAADNTLGLDNWGMPIRKIQLIAQFSANIPGDGTMVVFAYEPNSSVSYVNRTMQRRGVQGPTFLIAAGGIDAQNQLLLSGVINMEVIPNALLYRNVKTYAHPPTDPDAMARAEFVLNDPEINMRSVLTLKEYFALSKMVPTLISTDEEAQTVGFAAERPKLRRVLGRVLRGIANFAPQIGSIAGGLLGNEYTGRQLGTMFQQAYGSRQGGMEIGLAAEEVTMESLAAQMKAMNAMLNQLQAENVALKTQLQPVVAPSAIPVEQRATPTKFMKINSFRPQAPIRFLNDNGASDLMFAFKNNEQTKRGYTQISSSTFFPVVREGGGADIAMLIASNEPFALPRRFDRLAPYDEWYDVDYTPFGEVFIDTRLLGGAPEPVAVTMKDLGMFKYLTLWHKNDKLVVQGRSWRAAGFCAVMGCPSNQIITGDVYGEAESSHVEEKYTAANYAGKKLIIVGNFPFSPRAAWVTEDVVHASGFESLLFHASRTFVSSRIAEAQRSILEPPVKAEKQPKVRAPGAPPLSVGDIAEVVQTGGLTFSINPKVLYSKPEAGMEFIDPALWERVKNQLAAGTAAAHKTAAAGLAQLLMRMGKTKDDKGDGWVVTDKVHKKVLKPGKTKTQTKSDLSARLKTLQAAREEPEQTGEQVLAQME